MSRPSFTLDQMEYLRKLLGVRCCHVSGEHDPAHFQEDRYVCQIQKSEAFDAARKALGLRKIKPHDAEPAAGCGWCDGTWLTPSERKERDDRGRKRK